MRPSGRIDQLAKRYIQQAEVELDKACKADGLQRQLLASDVAIIICRATADYLDEEWAKKPNVVLQ